MKYYFPYKANDGKHKYFIITKNNKRVYFGAFNYSDYTIHKDNLRRLRYVKRHKKNEQWGKSGIDTAGWWSLKFLWSFPTKREAYNHIKIDLKKWKLI